MRRIYTLFACLAVPIVFLGVLLRAVRTPTNRGGLLERFGYGAHAPPQSLWVHAVSMGEVAAVAPLIRTLIASLEGSSVVLTSATPAGVQRARQLFGEQVDVRFAPYDLPSIARRFIERIRPRVAIFVETEIWPNLYRELARRSIPRIIVNARISDRSWPRYQRLQSLFGAALKDTIVVAQSARDAQRFMALGSTSSNVSVAGSLKFDAPVEAGVKTRGAQLRVNELAARAVWVAGSTHAGEEEIILAAQGQVRSRLESCVLVLAPRHAARFDAVARLLETLQIPFVRRSGASALDPSIQVMLLDTLGELPEFYAAANAAFVGGSLVPIGGHNLLEPCALGVPVATGPFNGNAPDVYRVLRDHDAIQCVRNAEELALNVHRWLCDPQVARRAGARAAAVIEANRGALKKTQERIEALCDSSGAH